METKFTKGPWSVNFEIGAIYSGYCLYICDSPGNNKSDAHLITAAPEMYEMLEDILKNYECGSVVDDQIEMILAKARGE